MIRKDISDLKLQSSRIIENQMEGIRDLGFGVWGLGH